MISQITIEDLITQAYIGVSEEEKKIQRQINWHVVFHFSTILQGCHDDDIDSTICYNDVSQTIAKVCAIKKYNLLEHLCMMAYNEIKKTVKTPITITTVKQYPPSELSYVSKFTISDI